MQRVLSQILIVRNTELHFLEISTVCLNCNSLKRIFIILKCIKIAKAISYSPKERNLFVRRQEHNDQSCFKNQSLRLVSFLTVGIQTKKLGNETICESTFSGTSSTIVITYRVKYTHTILLEAVK